MVKNINNLKKNLAASAQKQLNIAAENLLKYTFNKTKINNFA